MAGFALFVFLTDFTAASGATYEKADVSEIKARVCDTCKIEKPWTLEHWPEQKGQPRGPRCRTCRREYKRLFDRSAAKERVAASTQGNVASPVTVAPPASGGDVAISKAALPAELSSQRLEATRALRVGAAVLNEKAQQALDTLFKYVGDSTSSHHEWALKLVVERLLPRKLYEDLGAKDAGVLAGEGGSRPSVTIIVQPATVPAPAEIPGAVVVQGESVRVKESE